MQDKTKEDLRERILTLLRNQKEEERLSKSLVIGNKLFEMPEFQKSVIILFYASFDGEVDTFEMIKRAQNMGKSIGLPKIMRAGRKIVPILVENLEDDLVSGCFGIKEPKGIAHRTLALEDIDMVIVPGIAFDRYNNRLGRGGGHYDTFLRTLSNSIPTVGLAFDFQMIDNLPYTKEHDFPVSHVISN